MVPGKHALSIFYLKDSEYSCLGGGHCGAAETYPSVPATYHVNEALQAWVENDTFPAWIQSTNPPDGSSRIRKLCPWPEIAKLQDLTRPNFSESYECSRY